MVRVGLAEPQAPATVRMSQLKGGGSGKLTSYLRLGRSYLPQAGIIFYLRDPVLPKITSRCAEDNFSAAGGAMPSGMAAEMRAALPTMDRSGVVLQRSTKSKTGFVNVIEVGGKFQARLQVPGDGRGGTRKRKQVPLPGIYDTADDAAFALASFKKGMHEAGFSAAEAADKFEPKDKKHKPRSKPQQPAVPPTLPMFAMEPPVTVVGMPIPFTMHHMPFVAASPLPMQPLRFAPHFG